MPEFFPLPSLSFWLVLHVSCLYSGAQTEHVSLATILNLCCFNLYLFGLLSLFFLF